MLQHELALGRMATSESSAGSSTALPPLETISMAP